MAMLAPWSDPEMPNPNGALSTRPIGALDPRTMALLGAAQGFFQAGAPSRMPTGFGGAMAGGLQGGLQGAIQGQRLQQDQRKLDLEEQYRRFQMNRPQQPQNIMSGGPGTVFFDPVTRQPVYTVPTEPKPQPAAKPPETRKLRIGNEEVTQEYRDGQWHEVGRGPAFSSNPLVNIGGEQQETAFQKRVGQEMGDQYSNLLKADMNAPASIGKYQRLGQLLSNVNTGKFRGTIVDMKAAAKALGFDLSAMGIADDVAPAQAARALSNQIALELRNPAGGAGMPGALSDKDREFLVQSIPGLENDPAAIGKMIEYRVKLEQRAQQVARMARAYRKKNGKFDEGFYDELQEWSNKNPLFPNAPQAPKPAAAPAPTGAGALTPEEAAELEQLRKRFNR